MRAPIAAWPPTLATDLRKALLSASGSQKPAMRGQLKVRDWTKVREEHMAAACDWVHKEGVVYARAIPSIFPMSLQALWVSLGWVR